MQRTTEFGQELIAGDGSLLSLPDYLRQKKINSIIVVRGTHSFPAIINDEFWPENIKVNTVVTDAGLPDINKIKSKFENIKPLFPSLIVAVGGGLVIDTAKTMVYHSMQEGQQSSELIAIPSTAGSGSEATPFAVVYNGKNKQSLEAAALLPATVILDPLITSTLPVEQKAISGLDAWCQSIESFWSNKATAETKILSRKAFETIYDSLPMSVTKRKEPVSMELLLGAHYAGQAIRKTYTTGAHALSYHLTADFGIPHGQAVGLFLPVILRYNSSVEDIPVAVQQIPGLFGEDGMDNVIKKTVSFIRGIGLKATLHELQLPGLDIEILIDSVNMQRFANNPRPYDRQALLDCVKWSLNNME